jgi:taurine dioxygenase
MAISFRPLSAVIGVEVSGVDLSKPLTPDEVASMTKAWEEYGVLVFHDQHLSSEEQQQVTRYFGETQGLRGGPYAGSEYHYVSNVTVDGMEGNIPTGDMTFHQDGVYAENPAKGGMLFALEIPPVGGNTLFCSTARAYAALPEDLQQELLDYDVHFVSDYATHNRTVRQEKGKIEGWGATHALVITHPSTGHPLLICNTSMADFIIGLPKDQSDALLERLCKELEQPEFIYEHVWRVGDVLLWDNLAVQHARTDFDPNERRALRRTQLLGGETIPYRDVVRVAEASRQGAIAADQ